MLITDSETLKQYATSKRLWLTWARYPDDGTFAAIVSLVRKTPEDTDGCVMELVEDVRNYIDSNLERNNSVDDISREFGISSNYLQHIFKKHIGTSIVEYRNARRLLKAKILLSGCDDKIIEIATECGYENASYFSEVFKKETGMTPSQYRNQYRPKFLR